MKILIRNADNVVIYARADLALDSEAHGEGWRDPNFSTENARMDDAATLPDNWMGGVWSYSGGVWVVADAARYQEMCGVILTVRLASLLKQIDADADAIYAKALGNRATEYAQAEADATAYKAAGYTGTVPGYVQAWAAATGKSATWATDDILATSNAWRTAMAAIRLNRLGRKEEARKAMDAAALAVVKAQWDGFVTAITAQLGV